MLCRCELTEGGEEGVTAMDQSRVQMDSCHIHSNKGPALDISGHATVSAKNCSLHDNTGNGSYILVLASCTLLSMLIVDRCRWTVDVGQMQG